MYKILAIGQNSISKIIIVAVRALLGVQTVRRVVSGKNLRKQPTEGPVKCT